MFKSVCAVKAMLPIICFCSMLLAGCRPSHSATSNATGFYFDTIISVTIYHQDSDHIAEQCMELAEHYEKLFSPSIKGSDVWNINHSRGTLVTVDKDTLALLKTALNYARLSDGLVDPTVGSLAQLWNFGSDNQEIVPDKTLITQALSHVNYRNVVIFEDQVMLSDPEAQIELGFIAKGFIADKMKDFLLSEGVSSAIINLGGNILTVGNRPDGTPFRIGIQKPFSDSGKSVLTLALSDASVVSSGSYERCFTQNGKLYHHILSTSTGYPVSSGLSQVTIISSSSMTGDALSTLCFALGYEKAASLLENYPDIQAVFITEDGRLLYVNFNPLQ